MKPDWKDAPKWAEWLAMDNSGAWWFYELEPERIDDHWDAVGGSRASEYRPIEIEYFWSKTLEKKP